LISLGSPLTCFDTRVEPTLGGCHEFKVDSRLVYESAEELVERIAEEILDELFEKTRERAGTRRGPARHRSHGPLWDQMLHGHNHPAR
jgi:hypothetical protein